MDPISLLGIATFAFVTFKIGFDFGIDDESHVAYRMDKRLVSVVKKLGVDKASGKYASLRIVDVPDEVVEVHGWHISDYDGCESVHQSHWVG